MRTKEAGHYRIASCRFVEDVEVDGSRKCYWVCRIQSRSGAVVSGTGKTHDEAKKDAANKAADIDAKGSRTGEDALREFVAKNPYEVTHSEIAEAVQALARLALEGRDK